MVNIDLIAYRLLKWEADRELNDGLRESFYDAKENGRKIIMERQIWISDIEYYFDERKDRNEKADSITARIKGNFSVANIMGEYTEDDIFNQCVRILAAKMQEIVNKISENDSPTKINVIPPPDIVFRKNEN